MRDSSDPRYLEMTKSLDVGCGRRKLEGSIGIDFNARSDADVIHDLDQVPWPFEDNTFDYIRANDVMEHVQDFLACVREIARVAKPGARVDVRMPFMGSILFATDPTHRRAGTSRTFDYFDPTKEFGQYAYSDAKLEVLSFHYERFYVGVSGFVFRLMDKLLVPLAEYRHIEYESYWTGVYPMQNITYKLRVVKS